MRGMSVYSLAEQSPISELSAYLLNDSSTPATKPITSIQQNTRHNLWIFVGIFSYLQVASHTCNVDAFLKKTVIAYLPN